MYARVRDAHTKSSPVIHVPFIITFLLRLLLFFFYTEEPPHFKSFSICKMFFWENHAPNLSFQVVGHANIVPLMLYASALDPTNYSGRNVILVQSQGHPLSNGKGEGGGLSLARPGGWLLAWEMIKRGSPKST